MDFPAFDFNRLNEADVREEVLAPLLRYLGYRSGTEHDVLRELPLNYSKVQLGRQKASDVTLRGRADYICEAGRSVRWTLEAKPPHEALNPMTEAQAWTYANHPEVRGVYFVLSNGRRLQVFQTNRGPDAEPLFDCMYEELQTKLQVLRNILSPEAVLRDHPAVHVDLGVPIGPGLRSSAQIVKGHIQYDHVSPPLPPLEGMLMTITGGVIDRDKDGKLRAQFLTMIPNQQLHETNRRFGLNEMGMVSDSTVVSVEANSPTIFHSERSVHLPAGERILNMTNWSMVTTPTPMNVIVTSEASGHLHGDAFSGRFAARLLYVGYLTVNLQGGFEILLQ